MLWTILPMSCLDCAFLGCYAKLGKCRAYPNSLAFRGIHHEFYLDELYATRSKRSLVAYKCSHFMRKPYA